MDSSIVVFKPSDSDAAFEFPTEGETGWATQAQLAEVFDVDRTSVTRHLQHIFEEGEVDESEHVQKVNRFKMEGDREVKREIPTYSLSVAIALGFRAHSRRAIEFRKWANEVIRNLIEGKIRLEATEKADVATLSLLERTEAILGELKEQIKVERFNRTHKRGTLATSQHTGVSYNKATGRWRAYLSLNGEFKLWKEYRTEAEAVMARREAEDKWCGDAPDLPKPIE